MANKCSASRKAGNGSSWIRKSKRLALYSRDGFCCVFCGSGSEDGALLTLDHVVACDDGGTNHESNLVTACLSCNSAKRNLSMRAWLAYLRAKGIDTEGMAARVRRQTARALNRKEGLRLLAARQAEKKAA